MEHESEASSATVPLVVCRNLPADVSTEAVEARFASFGKVASITRTSPTAALVGFSAKEAVKKLTSKLPIFIKSGTGVRTPLSVRLQLDHNANYAEGVAENEEEDEEEELQPVEVPQSKKEESEDKNTMRLQLQAIIEKAEKGLAMDREATKSEPITKTSEALEEKAKKSVTIAPKKNVVFLEGEKEAVVQSASAPNLSLPANSSNEAASGSSPPSLMRDEVEPLPRRVDAKDAVSAAKALDAEFVGQMLDRLRSLHLEIQTRGERVQRLRINNQKLLDAFGDFIEKVESYLQEA